MSLNLTHGFLDIDAFADVPVTVEVRLGCKPTTLEAIAKLDVGNVVPLDRAAGETFDVYVGDLRLATAEVVIVDDRLSIRVTDLSLAATASDTSALS